ncbi:MAG: hypothetical protein ACLT2C_05755 [Ruminococcus sp.]
MDAKKRCPNCGCICEADSVFCEECGASLEQTKPPVQNGENSWKNSAPPVTNAGGSKAASGNPKKVGFILLILLLAALLAVLVLLLVWNVGLRKEQTSAGQEALETAQVMTEEASQPALETTAEDTEAHFQFAAQTTTAVTTRSAAGDAETQALRRPETALRILSTAVTPILTARTSIGAIPTAFTGLFPTVRKMQ